MLLLPPLCWGYCYILIIELLGWLQLTTATRAIATLLLLPPLLLLLLSLCHLAND